MRGSHGPLQCTLKRRKSLVTTVHYDHRLSQLAWRTFWIALRIASPLAITLGFSLLFMPVWNVLTPEMSLVVQKLISVMGGVVVVIVLGLGFLLLGTWSRRRLINLQQARNDLTAQRIMSELRANPEAPVAEFFLYLRAFETTGRLRVPLYLRLRKLSVGLNQLVTNDVESYVSNAVRGVAPLIALGRPGEAIGAGRIVTEDANWMADIVTLMKRAKGILLVPSSRPGTLWEIETLKHEGLLNKVIFIMPPRTKGRLDTRERWEVARQALNSYGLQAPEHHEQGLLFEVGPDGRISNVEPLLLNSARQVRKSLERIMSDTPPKGGLFKAIAVADKRIRRATFWGWGETSRQLSPFAIAAVAMFVDHPAVGFNPSEPWSTVWDRSMTARIISDHELSKNIELAMSEKYRAIVAQTPEEKLAELGTGLLLRGLFRLDNDKVKAYFTALGEMLARVDTKTCAAIAGGEIQPAAMEIAFSYIPPQRIHGFLRAKTAAILAEAENAPVPPIDDKVVTQATQQFLANLDPENQQRYERINQAQGKLSDDDRCWLVRAMYGSVGTLAEPHASVWARTLAAMSIPIDEATGL